MDQVNAKVFLSVLVSLIVATIVGLTVHDALGSFTTKLDNAQHSLATQ